MKERILNIGNICGAIYFVFAAALFFFFPMEHKLPLILAGASIVAVTAVLFNKIVGAVRKTAVCSKMPTRNIYIACALAMLVIDLIIAVCLRYVPVTDSSYMDLISRNFVEGRELYTGLDEFHTFYLERYSNQWGLFLIEILAYKASYMIFGYIPDIVLPLMTVASFQITYYLMYKLAGKVFNETIHKNLCLIFVFINPVLYAYSCIYYTDTASMPFVMGSLYLVVSAFECSTKKRFALLSCAAALCIGAGYCIKGNIAVIAVAAIIYAVFKLSWKRALSFTAAVVVGFSGMKLLVTQMMYASEAITEQSVETYGFPMTHWVMMGLEGRGGYDDDSFKYTFSQPDKQTRNQTSIDKIKEKLGDYGATGLAKHLLIKIRYTWSGGAYQATWQMHKTPDGHIQRFFAKSKIFLGLCFVFQCLLIFFMLVSFISSAIKRRIDFMFIVRLTVFGLGFFLLIWETRSRYMLNMLPLFIMISVDGMAQFTILTERLRAKIGKNS